MSYLVVSNGGSIGTTLDKIYPVSGRHEWVDDEGGNRFYMDLYLGQGRFRLLDEPSDEPAPVAATKNPKDALGAIKLPLHLVPGSMIAMASLSFLNGALKYGRCNWRTTPVSAAIYADAACRHIADWFEGRENDPDDDVPNLAAALACIGIIIDAKAAGTLIDDRNVTGGYAALRDTLTGHVARLKAMHAGRTPRHYTIADNSKEIIG